MLMNALTAEANFSDYISEDWSINEIKMILKSCELKFDSCLIFKHESS